MQIKFLDLWSETKVRQCLQNSIPHKYPFPWGKNGILSKSLRNIKLNKIKQVSQLKGFLELLWHLYATGSRNCPKGANLLHHRRCFIPRTIPQQWFLNSVVKNYTLLKIIENSPGSCGSVDWALACKPKGCQLDSQSGHMPGLQARSPVGGVWEATTHWCFSPSLPPSLPLSLKINK